MLRALIATGAAALGLAACAGTGDEGARPRAPQAAPPAEPVLAVRNGEEGSELFWADGRSLEPVDGRSFSVPFFYSVAERSPDGKALALGANDGALVQLVDLESMRPLGTIDLSPASFVESLQWAAPDLLFAGLGGEEARVAALDPGTGEIVSEHALGGTVVYSRPAGAGLAFLLAPRGRIGPARLAVFDGLRVRVAKLAEIRAGWEPDDGPPEEYRTRQAVPALAVEAGGGRALVVPAGRRVAEVDLGTLEVRYHDLAEPVSVLGRLRDWLEPAAAAKLVDGADRNAVWLPNGLIAVSGAKSVARDDGIDLTPAGLSLIDPVGWSVRRVSDEPSWVSFRDGALLGAAWREGPEPTLLVFSPDGTPRFTLERSATDMSQIEGGFLYAAAGEGARYEIVDLASGETVGRPAPARSTWLVVTE